VLNRTGSDKIIRVRIETYRRIQEWGVLGESFDTAINRALDAADLKREVEAKQVSRKDGDQ
jgi:flavin-binding protein dodecin